MQLKAIIFPFLSGLCGSLAGSFGKITFQDSSFGFNSEYLNYGIRGLSFLMILFFNQLMMKFMLNSFQLNGATLTVLFSFIFNSASNITVGYLLYNESISLQWGVGMFFIVSGVLLLAEKKNEQEQNSEIKEDKQKSKEKTD